MLQNCMRNVVEFPMPPEPRFGCANFETLFSMYPNISKYINMDFQQNEIMLNIVFQLAFFPY